jgi:hypothetical protein
VRGGGEVRGFHRARKFRYSSGVLPAFRRDKPPRVRADRGMKDTVFSHAVLRKVALFLFCTVSAVAADPKPGRYAGTMTVTYDTRDTGPLGVANKVTYKVIGEGNPSSDADTPGIILYLLAPPLPGEIVPSHGKITSVNFRVDPPNMTYSDASNNTVTFSIPMATLPVVKGDAITLPDTELGFISIGSFRYRYSVSFRVRRVP